VLGPSGDGLLGVVAKDGIKHGSGPSYGLRTIDDPVCRQADAGIR
jgi:hypothetical protein